MNREEYLKLVKKYSPSEERLKNGLKAFFSGGVIGIISNFIYEILLNNNVSSTDATVWTLLILIFLASLFTGLGFFDNLVSKFRCGLIIPITGFAHSITSCAVDYKKEGLIMGMGSNVFKLAGCVLFYGIISSFFLTFIEVIIHG